MLFKLGDRVRAKKPISHGEPLQDFIGKVGTVVGKTQVHIRVKFDDCNCGSTWTDNSCNGWYFDRFDLIPTFNCFQCGKLTSNLTVYININNYKTYFHFDCFQEIAGKKFIDKMVQR